ncbi:MAG TPA: phage tail sheath subtilisin-like domain-containing protein [Thermoanaerobaculia bacterium]
MRTFATPGVYREDAFQPRPAELPTGVPVFLGFAEGGKHNQPERLTARRHFADVFGQATRWLAVAVEGFFANEGEECFVVRLDETAGLRAALDAGLKAAGSLVDVDLVCTPDAFHRYEKQHDETRVWEDKLRAEALQLQNVVLAHCDARGDRLALLDAPPGALSVLVRQHRDGLTGTNGAFYYPWVQPVGRTDFAPPCGHVAGVIARTDRRRGVHKPPANEVLQGVADLERILTDADQAELNPVGINALRAFPGRGLRVWGARTVAKGPASSYVSVRRLFLTAARWIERNLAAASFEPSDLRLWNRITRELTVYFESLFAAGALKGRTPAEAFYVKCDAATNPPEVREAGMVVTEIGLAPALPNEFVIVRIRHGPGGVEVSGPSAG